MFTQLGLGIFHVGPLGLLFGQIVGESAGMVTLAKQFWSQNKYNLQAVTYTSIRDVARKYKDFPIYQSTGSFLNSAGLQIPSLLFATYYGIEVAGWFYLTQKVLAAPITLIGSSVAKVFWGEAARLTGQPRELQKLFRKVNVNLFMIGIVPTMILFIGGQWIFTFVFGHKWLQSGVFVQIMAFVFLLKFTTDSSINFAIIEKHRSTVFWALLRLISVVLGIMAAVWCGLQAFWAVLFFSIAMILSYAIRYFMWTYSVHELIINQERIQSAISGDQ